MSGCVYETNVRQMLPKNVDMFLQACECAVMEDL